MKYCWSFWVLLFVAGCTNHTDKTETVCQPDSLSYESEIPKDAIPFQFTGQHIIVQAMMNDSTKISLLMDTGAQQPVFDSTFIANNKDKLNVITKSAHGIIQSPSGLLYITERITGSITLNAFGEDKKFRGALTIANLKELNLEADAIFPAYLLLEDKIVMIDLWGNYIRILPDDTLNILKSQYINFPLKGTQFTYFSISTSIVLEKAPNPPVTIEGDLQIDLGAPGFLYLFKRHEKVNTVFTPALKLLNIQSLAFSRKDTITSEAFTANRLTLSDSLTFSDARINLIHQFINIDTTQIGLVGNEFLYKFNVILDYKHKQLYLRPNKVYGLSCRNSNLGMRFIKDKKANSYVVSSLYDGTPAAIAGIHLGDEILSINGTLTNNMEEAEMDSIYLSPIGTKISLLVQRGDSVYEKTISIRNIW